MLVRDPKVEILNRKKMLHTPVVVTPPVGAILEENCWFEVMTAAVELWSFAALILRS